MKIIDFLLNEYEKVYACKPLNYTKVSEAGSNRTYYRFNLDNKNIIAAYSENIAETETFIYYSQVFAELKFNVPTIYYVSEDKKIYFIEDLGHEDLLNIVTKELKINGFNDKLINLYKKVIDELVKMQFKALKTVNFSKAYSISEFDEESIMFDLNYFKYYFLNRIGVLYNEKQLQSNFISFAKSIANINNKVFMFRDFQARNIIINNNMPFFIDYQGGRLGAAEYDLASLLYQAKAQIPNDVKQILLDYYYSKYIEYKYIDRKVFDNQFYNCVYIRVIQTLGAYGFRGLIENKSHFIESISLAISNLKELLSSHPNLNDYYELNRVLNEISELNKFNAVKLDNFRLTIYSFSYKKGLPSDDTGNGGGFVFDCRAIENPGRYAEYKTLTGKDEEVINFFKNNSSIDVFIKDVLAIVEPSVETYIKRGFTSLMINFGCTGGQHRSVYCAENVYKYFKDKYNIDIKLIHREMPDI